MGNVAEVFLPPFSLCLTRSVYGLSQENEVDSLRYAGLPSGDHSVEVEGLGLFAPTGSYAHGRNRGGLGDEEEQEVRTLLKQRKRLP